MVQKRLKSLKKSLRKPMKKQQSKRQWRKKQERQQSRRQGLKSRLQKSRRQKSRRSACFSVIPKEIMNYNDQELKFYIKFSLLRNGVDDKKIISSYRKLSLNLHPDKNPPENNDLATEMFKILQHYYEEFMKLYMKDREIVFKTLLKEKEEKDNPRQEPIPRHISIKQREVDRINRMSTDEKREEIIRLRRHLKSIRKRQADEYSFLSRILNTRNERLEILKRAEMDVLEEMRMFDLYDDDAVVVNPDDY
jgi:hypothetical protein